MFYYYKPEDRLIHTDETKAKYGTERALPALGVLPLTVQPDYLPVGFRDMEDGTFYPIESYTAMQLRCIKALVEAGYTQEEAEKAIS